MICEFLLYVLLLLNPYIQNRMHDDRASSMDYSLVGVGSGHDIDRLEYGVGGASHFARLFSLLMRTWDM